MTKQTIQIDSATEAQLRKFAAEVLVIEVKPQTPLHIIKAKVKAAWGQDSFDLPEEGGSDEAPVAAPRRALAENPEKVTVIVAEGPEAGGDQPIWVAVNGRGMWVLRGVEQVIPYAYFGVLRDAVQFIYPEAKIDPLTGELGGLGKPREIPTYPFQRVA